MGGEKHKPEGRSNRPGASGQQQEPLQSSHGVAGGVLGAGAGLALTLYGAQKAFKYDVNPRLPVTVRDGFARASRAAADHVSRTEGGQLARDMMQGAQQFAARNPRTATAVAVVGGAAIAVNEVRHVLHDVKVLGGALEASAARQAADPEPLNLTSNPFSG